MNSNKNSYSQLKKQLAQLYVGLSPRAVIWHAPPRNELKSKINEKNFNWLFLSVWLGLRPKEIENFKDPKYWRKESLPTGRKVLWVFQTKIVALPPEGRWKPIPILYDEQHFAFQILQGGNFNRPLIKTMRLHFGRGINLYAGRKGFSDLMLSRGKSLPTSADFRFLPTISIQNILLLMAKKIRKKIITVREHPLHVPVSEKNPTGITIRDRHLRRLEGTYLDAVEIVSVFKNYDRKGIVYPTAGKLKHKNADKYDEDIAVWTDYFNKKFNAIPPLDPDVVKALIDSESDFRADPRENKKALGITQITPKTLKIVQDPKGEAKDFIFNKIRQKDLKNPSVAIPMSVRWLFRKRTTAMNQLKRAPDNEELILEYKGLLKSDSEYKKAALKKYREAYAKLKE